ncbi:MAG: PAS domain S-box protein [bacterium]
MNDKEKLRIQAEAKLAQAPKTKAPQSAEEIRQAFHELQVHQIELEMQNDKLRQAFADLAVEQERYFDLYDLAPMGYITIDENGLIQNANLAAARLLGVDRGQLINHPFFHFIQKEEQDVYYRHHKQLVTTAAQQDYELRMMKQDGMVFWSQLLVTLAQESDGTKLCQIVLTDITARKQAEDALRNSEAKYRSLVETTGTGYLIIDGEGRVLDANQEYVRLSGHRELREISGRRVVEWTADYEKEKNALAVASCARDGFVRNFVVDYIDGAGHVTPVEINATAEGKGPGFRIVSLCRDVTARHLAAAELKHSHDLLANLARLVPGVIYQYRLYPDGRSAFPYSSPGMHDIYECTPEEVREDATPVFGRLHPDDYERVGNAIQESARSLQEFYCEFRVILPRQGLRWRWSQAHPERLADGSTLWHGIISDITEHKLAEEALRASESKFRLLAESIQDVFWISTPTIDRIIYVSPAFENIWGRTCESLYQQPQIFSEVIHPEDQGMVGAALQEHVKGTWDIEYRIIRPDGSVRWILDRGFPVYNDGGELALMCGVAKDITERKQAEESLRRYEMAVEQSSDGIAIADMDGRLTFVNSAWARMHGYETAEMLGQFISISHSPEQMECDVIPFNDVLREKGANQGEIGHWRKDGSTFPTWMTVTIMKDDHGKRMGLVGIAADITEMKRAEQERLRLSAAIEQAHDVVVVTDHEGAILYVNPAFEKVTGYSRQEALGQNPRILKSGKHDAEFYRRMWNTLASGGCGTVT